MTYTKDIINLTYFLNDKNIAQSLDYGNILINAIPSLDLVSSLYNELSSKDKAISNQVDANRTADKAELSNVLSTYTNDEISKLSTNLSNLVNKEFVHISGDTIEFINVKNHLSVASEATIDSNVRIKGSLIQGESVKATQKGGIALGISAEAIHTNSFVWNGNDNIENYTSHGERGTFNINPEQGVNGFYIGLKTLSSVIHDDTQLSVNDLTTKIVTTSSVISNLIDANRTADKAELSNVLSTYTNDIYALISNQVDANRTADKAELSNVLSTYTNDITTSLSNTVKNAGFTIAADTTFTYDEHTHKISLIVSDYTGNKTILTVDTSDFIKNRIVDHVDVVAPTLDPSLSETVLRIWWTPEAGTTAGIYTDIPISLLAKVYKEGYGIHIDDDLTINVTNTIATTSALNEVAATLNVISSNTIPAVKDDIISILSYVNTLSSESDSNPGIVKALSNAIKQDVKNLDLLSTSMKSISADLSSNIDTNKHNIATIQEFNDSLSNVAGGIPVGAIPDISHDIEVLDQRFNIATIYAGKISICKYHPDWVDAGYGNNLSSIIKYFNLVEDDKIKNGSIFEVEFTEDTYTFTNPVFAADQTYITDDNFKLTHKDWLYIAADPGKEYVDLTSINASNVRFMNAVKFNELYELSNIVNNNYIWLSGNNTTTATYDISVKVSGRTPLIVQLTGHAISGDNEFLGVNTFKNISVDNLSGDNLSANILDATNISTDYLYVDLSNVYNKNVNSRTNSLDTLLTNLSNEISSINSTFKTLYSQISNINDSSDLNTIINAVVYIKNALQKFNDD